MDMLPMLALTLLVNKIIDAAKLYIPDGYTNMIVPLSMFVGVACVVLASTSPVLAPEIGLFGDVTLADADIAAQLMYGAVLGAGAGVIHDLGGGRHA